MIDPMTALALSIQARKGLFAFLIGSGCSRSASIPTGWEITSDLIRKSAALQGESVDDPIGWYTSKFKSEPNYSEVLQRVAKTPAERASILRTYFEPSEEDRERGDGTKEPQICHKAIAELVADGYIKIIVTTNFDRLIENALIQKGITPTVVSTPQGAQGLEPLQHKECVVFKLHGDYLDAKTLNTEEELTKYNRHTLRLLERIIDEYGLVACGWSGDSDIALKLALERKRQRRYSFYWATSSKLSHEAEQLRKNMTGEKIEIKDADQFFGDLADRVKSANDQISRKEISIPLATATVRRWVVDPLHDLRLAEKLRLEADIAVEKMNEPIEHFITGYTQEIMKNQIGSLSSSVDMLSSMASVVGYWGQVRHHKPLIDALKRLSRAPKISVVTEVALLPSLMVFYCIGVSAALNNNYRLINELLRFQIRIDTQTKPFLNQLNWSNANTVFIPIQNAGKSSMTTWMYSYCQQICKAIIPSEYDYDRAFDEFELLMAAYFIDFRLEGKYANNAMIVANIPFGRFIWKIQHLFRDEMNIARKLLTNGSLKSELLSVGFCNGDEENYENVVQRVVSIGNIEAFM